MWSGDLQNQGCTETKDAIEVHYGKRRIQLFWRLMHTRTKSRWKSVILASDALILTILLFNLSGRFPNLEMSGSLAAKCSTMFTR